MINDEDIVTVTYPEYHRHRCRYIVLIVMAITAGLGIGGFFAGAFLTAEGYSIGPYLLASPCIIVVGLVAVCIFAITD